MSKYSQETLVKFCSDNSITLTLDYSSEPLNVSTKIEGKCSNQECENNFNYALSGLYKHTIPLCKKCVLKNTQAKFKKTCLEKFGCENPFQNEKCKEKIKETCIEKYGVEYCTQNEEVKSKAHETNLEKYGCKNPFQNEEIKEKIRKTNLEKYGVENCMHNENVKLKGQETNLEKYGYRNPFQNKKCKEKIRKTNFEKYGVEHPNQNKEIMDKNSKKAYKIKTYTLPSGKEIKIQGYEHFALNKLLETYSEDQIITGCKNVPEIWYNDEAENDIDIL